MKIEKILFYLNIFYLWQFPCYNYSGYSQLIICYINSASDMLVMGMLPVT